jgi:hypothetical protein
LWSAWILVAFEKTLYVKEKTPDAGSSAGYGREGEDVEIIAEDGAEAGR